MFDKIVLVGYMASGKSTVGSLLAHQTQLNFIDLDQFIESKEGMSVADIFVQKGEIYFRKLEAICLRELVTQTKNFVLSLGGGTPCFANNMTWLQTQDVCTIFLKASPQTILERIISQKSTRPLLANIDDKDLLEFITKHLFERNYYYLQATHKVNIDHKTTHEVLEEVLQIIRDKH